MKIAKASDADLHAALEVCRLIGDLEKRYMPVADPDQDERDYIEWFDRDDPEHCVKALWLILDAAEKGSLFRVIFGMTVILDPRNEIVDPDSDVLELHPAITKAIAVRASTGDKA